MNARENSKKTRRQLRRSATTSLLIALAMVTIPAVYVRQYEKSGFIYTGKGHTVTASGNEALLIIYGTIAAVIFGVSIALYHAGKCLLKVTRGEFAEVDESPEFVICQVCKTPQYSKDLVNGHCRDCAGAVESLEGYYERHPEQRGKVEPEGFA